MKYKIKELREELKMTQEELSQKSGISRVTIINLEKDGTANTKTLCKIAEALNVSLSQIFL